MRIDMVSRITALMDLYFPSLRRGYLPLFRTKAGLPCSRRDTFAIEAVGSSEALIHLPTLHILIKSIKAPNGDCLWSGYCLDLGIFAFSTEKEEEDIKRDIFDLITNMAIFHILRSLEKGTEAKLLCKPPDTSSSKTYTPWVKFNMVMGEQRISLLKNSYDRLLGNDLQSKSASMYSKEMMNRAQINRIMNAKAELHVEELKKFRDMLVHHSSPLYVMTAA